MTDSKVSADPLVISTALADDDNLPLVSGGANKRTRIRDLRAKLIAASGVTNDEILTEPAAPTTYTWTGSTLGQVGSPSNFTLAVAGPVSQISPVTFTYSDGSGGGSFNPASHTFGGDILDPTATTVYTPAGTAGTRTIAVSSGGKLTDPAPVTLTVTTGANNGSLPFASPAPVIDIDPNNDPTVTTSGGYVTSISGGNNTSYGATLVQTSANSAVPTLDTVTLPNSLGTKKAITLHPGTEALDIASALAQLRSILTSNTGVLTVAMVVQLEAAGGNGLFDFGQSSSTTGFVNHMRLTANQASSAMRTISSDGTNNTVAYAGGGSATLNVPILFVGTFKNKAQPEAQHNHGGIVTGTGTVPDLAATLANFDNLSVGNYKLNNAYQTNINNQFKLLRLLAWSGDQLNDATIADWATANYGTP